MRKSPTPTRAVPESLRDLNSAVATGIYSQLLENEIRVVKISPSPNFFDPVKCSLLTVPLNSNFQYDALSYTWGSRERPRTIILEGKEFRVTRNLHRALARLRLPRAERVAWIDALSINQCSILERNSQVLLMTKIYAQAKRTIAWLGDSYNPEVLEFLVFISHSGDAVLDMTASGDQEQLLELLRLTASLTRLPYWTRAWVFQEAVASKELVLQYGDTMLSMEAFSNFWKRLEPHAKVGPDTHLLASDHSTSSMYKMMIMDLPLQLLQPTGFDTYPLFNYINWVYEFCLKRNCENPRDKVFAALSLFPRQVQKGIRVDYSLNVQTVFADATRSFAEVSGDIAPILECFDRLGRCDISTSAFPSWIPNYLFRSTEAHCERASLLLHDTRSREDKLKSTQLSPDEPIFGFSGDGQVLKVSAYHVGSVAQASSSFMSAVPRLGSWRGDYMSFGIDSMQKLQVYYRYCREALKVSDQDLPSFLCTIGLINMDLDGAGAIWTLLTSSKCELKNIMRDEHDSTSQSYLFLCTNMPFLHYRRSLFVFKPSMSFQSLRPRSLPESNYSTLLNSAALYGIGPEEMQEGDQVYVIPGNDMPVVVRPGIGGLKLVGNASLAILREADWFWEKISTKSLDLQEIGLV